MRHPALTTTSLKLSHRLVYFIGIGVTASLTHILIVLSIVSCNLLQPLIANIIAYSIAFNVSFFGHKYLTFSQLHDQKQLSLPHFILVASSAGIINELLYFLFLTYTHLNYITSLILVLGMVSVYTYILSRFWACR